MGSTLVPQRFCWGRVIGKGLRSLQGFLEDAVAAEELHLPPTRSPRSTARRDREHKVLSGKPGSGGVPRASLEEQDQGIGLWESVGRRAKAGWASLPQLFRSPGNWPMPGASPPLNSAHLPITPCPFPQPRLFFTTFLKSLEISARYCRAVASRKGHPHLLLALCLH